MGKGSDELPAGTLMTDSAREKHGLEPGETVTEPAHPGTGPPRSEELFRFIVESARDYAIFATDTGGRVISWNAGAERIFGYREEEIMGQDGTVLFTPEDVRNLIPEKEEARAVAEGQAEDERWHARKGGSRFWASGLVMPLRDDAGDLRGFVKMARDQTERKRIEEERDRIFRLPLDMLCVLGLDGYFRRVNPAFEMTLGYTADELLAAPIFEFIHPDDRAETFAAIKRLAEGEQTDYLENRFRRADGSYAWTAWTYFPVADEGLAYGVGRDITQQRELLARERSARAEAEKANRLKDEFLATLSHELRTPLTAILGWSKLLRTGTLDERNAARALETIERNADAQRQLIEDILDVSRIITGKLHLDVHPITLAPVLEAAMESMRPAAQAKNIKLQVSAGARVAMVLGDADRLRQVIWNLLANAVKFTPEGGSIEARLERLGSAVQVEVSDTGQGIEPEFLPYVFDRFRQADATTTRKQGGLGLGLAIVRHLVELHGGTVHAASEGVGRGTTFTILLPAAGQGGEAGAPLSSHAVEVEATVGCPPPLNNLRVLVVEDEPDTQEFLRMLLEGCGALVASAASVAEALRSIEEAKPDVLISDIGLPQEDGYALIRQVRRLGEEQGGRIPAIALTAYARAQDRRRAIRAGFQMHLAKPVEPSELAEAVASLAGRAGKD